MLQTVAARYEQVKIQTTSKGELLLALYDGLFKFLRGARICFEQKQTARARELTSKSHAIISELQIALDASVSPDLCAQLSSLYTFCLDSLRTANANADAQQIDDVIRVLSPLKEAWEKAVPDAARQGICHRAE